MLLLHYIVEGNIVLITPLHVSVRYSYFAEYYFTSCNSKMLLICCIINNNNPIIYMYDQIILKMGPVCISSTFDILNIFCWYIARSENQRGVRELQATSQVLDWFRNRNSSPRGLI